jgi:hypothetical protein
MKYPNVKPSIARSAPGQPKPNPSPTQNVPNAESRTPTTNLSVFSGIAESGLWMMIPKAPTSKSATSAPTLAGISRPTPPAPTAITMKITSIPSRHGDFKSGGNRHHVPMPASTGEPPKRLRFLGVSRCFVVHGDYAGGTQDCLTQPPHAEEKQKTADDELNVFDWNLVEGRTEHHDDAQEQTQCAAGAHQRAGPAANCSDREHNG